MSYTLDVEVEPLQFFLECTFTAAVSSDYTSLNVSIVFAGVELLIYARFRQNYSYFTQMFSHFKQINYSSSE